MAKPLPGWFMIGLTSIVSFGVLFATNLITEPILINRENERYLDLLNLDSFVGITIGETEIPTGALATAGVQEVKAYFQQNNLYAVTYQVTITGYNPGLTYRIGIRQGLIQTIRVDNHSETPGYGANLLTIFPETLQGIPIENEASWTTALIGVSTGVTFTRNGLLNSLTTIRTDYLGRIAT
jgi:uncharacterized protein with FMN-binding domain